MTTRADELVSAFARAASAVDTDPRDRELVHALAVRCGWGARDVSAPLLPSGVSHGVPWGVSIVPGTRELRVFVEAQADPPGLEAYGRAARGVSELAAEHGASLGRLDAVVSVLAPPPGDPARPARPPRLWHAVAFAPGRSARWHAYVVVPPDRPHAAWAALRAAGIAEPAIELGPRDRITIVSLDLAEPARVKAYVLAPDASLDDVARLHDRATGAVAGDAQRFGRAMLGDPRRIWWFLALGFRADGGERAAPELPATCALHLGVPRHLDEPVARARIAALLAEHAIDPAGWQRAIAGGDVAHHFVSFQRREGRPRVTTYFLPRVRR